MTFREYLARWRSFTATGQQVRAAAKAMPEDIGGITEVRAWLRAHGHADLLETVARAWWLYSRGDWQRRP